jgi:hypothetical protein
MILNKINKIFLFFILLFSLYCCNNKKQSNEIQTYQYSYWVTTGIADNIYFSGKTIPIKFHKKSNASELELLNNLNSSVLFPSSERIFLIGKLNNEIKKVPEKNSEGIDLAEGGEKYQEFELIHWYILCPFKEDIGMPDETKIIERKKLQPKDLGLGIIGQMFVNMDDYQKQE